MATQIGLKPRVLLESLNGKWAKKSNHLAAAVRRWLGGHPLLFVLFAHAVFSIGIWNARDGYAEETSNVACAFRLVRSQQPNSSIYVNLIALTLRYLTPDPVVAVTLLKYVSSLLATAALCLTLSCFARILRRSAIIFACLVWIASDLNAPFLQSTSLSLFTFAVMLFGIYCLLRRESIPALSGFYLLGLLAASLRPEYYLPVALITLLLTGQAVWRGAQAMQSRFGPPHYWVCGVALVLGAGGGVALWMNPPAALARKAASLDSYALLGLGQCYADYYGRKHPREVFSPMTEYQALLGRTFNEPKGFLDAIKNNPGEAMRYFVNNAGRNLFQCLPRALLGHYREQSEQKGRGWLYHSVRGILLVGGLLGAVRLYRAGWIWNDFFSKIVQRLGKPGAISRKLLLLVVLLSTSAASIVLLVGTPRYFLPWIPLSYLGVAYCADSLLNAFRLVRFEACLVAGSCLCLCSPNFLVPRPNYEMDALRHVTPLVNEPPRIAAWWAEPDVVLGLCGKAKPVSSWEGIWQTDIENGRIDVLMVDPNLRSTHVWAVQQEFFERFERQPESCGFTKLIGYPSGRFDVYYKLKRPST